MCNRGALLRRRGGGRGKERRGGKGEEGRDMNSNMRQYKDFFTIVGGLTPELCGLVPIPGGLGGRNEEGLVGVGLGGREGSSVINKTITTHTTQGLQTLRTFNCIHCVVNLFIPNIFFHYWYLTLVVGWTVVSRIQFNILVRCIINLVIIIVSIAISSGRG